MNRSPPKKDAKTHTRRFAARYGTTKIAFLLLRYWLPHEACAATFRMSV
jgi:hypothetical protein